MYAVALSEAFRSPFNSCIHISKPRDSAIGSHSAGGLGHIVKGNKIQAYGRVTECRGGTTYVVQIDDSDITVLCELGGTLYRRRKYVTTNTRVKIEAHLLSPNKGRIVERIDDYKDLLYANGNENGEAPRQQK